MWQPKPGTPLAVLAPVSSGWMGILEHKAGEKVHPVGHRLPTYKECVKHNGRDLGHLEVMRARVRARGSGLGHVESRERLTPPPSSLWT